MNWFPHSTLSPLKQVKIYKFPLRPNFNPLHLHRREDTMILDWDRKWLGDFNAGKTQLVSFAYLNNWCDDHDMDEPVLDEKSSLKILLSFAVYSELDWCS